MDEQLGDEQVQEHHLRLDSQEHQLEGTKKN